ncbi:NAD+ synthase [Halococcoides cellulosivorans]|uniref:NH(3)-dependent NAD(+) synthetase n=1 Tax=Halococcoides cellulosivorans TaxID=1679096 RepID=A0A2R4X066_9EURY|nr:NAD+ synthase [Halococcoides cellulosivorans]AWB27167.1 NAD(+) synthetase [Halococcoides cellulosivorans]
MTDSDLATADDPLDLRFSDEELAARRDHVTDFVREFVDRAGVERAVIGLSGGVDSSTVAAVASEALGPDAVHGLVMPSSVDDDEIMSDAERLAEQLGIAYDVLPVGEIVETTADLAPEVRDDRMAMGNLRVRARTLVNYSVANAEDAIVLGTGNRTESLIGYFTKYGDGAVDCLPIANLYKQQVRQLARDLGVPESIAGRTPTAGMWLDQTDEAELGVEYDTLDSILALHVEGGVPATATARTIGVDREVVRDVRELYERSAHKRSMPPGPDRP